MQVQDGNGGWRRATPEEVAAHDAEVAARQIDPKVIKNFRDGKISAIDALRNIKIAAGVSYQFPDGAGTVQTRNLVDARNILTNVSSALILQAGGETGAVMTFRDAENIDHAMTPTQMLAMGLAVSKRGQAIYSASWVHKDAIALCQTLAELEQYDITQGWP